MTKARAGAPMADLPYSTAEQWRFPHIDAEPGQPVNLVVGDFLIKSADIGPIRFGATSRFIIDHLMGQEDGAATKSEILSEVGFLPGRAPATRAGEVSARANGLISMLGGKDVILGSTRERGNVRYHICDGLVVVRVGDDEIHGVEVIPPRGIFREEPAPTREVLRRQAVAVGSAEHTPDEIREILGAQIRGAIKKGKKFNALGLGLHAIELAKRELKAMFGEIEGDEERDRFKDVSIDLATAEQRILDNQRARATRARK